MEKEKTKIIDGWKWEHFEDGSGGLLDPEGKTFLSYDLATQEYKLKDEGWKFFPNYPDHMSRDEFVAYIEAILSCSGNFNKGAETYRTSNT